ncbi:FMN-dependent NADH-azoreductase [Clostridium sp.]|uniref:FMN-dependent NADH-azoreductase n=1 Tax=Clostridium sp. TaxID=1506 RepID=UPI002FC9AEA2
MKLLHIIVNSKPEDLSSSRKVAVKLIDKIVDVNPECQVETIDLYKDYIPRLNYKYFESRSAVVNKEAYDKLNDNEKKDVDRINQLCDQFVAADLYVISAPMWNLSFPAPLKEYIDCICQEGKTVTISIDKIKGTLDDKDRKMVYVQSSGGPVPWILRGKLSQGVEYVEDIMKFLGIKIFKELLITNTGFDPEARIEAEHKAILKMESIIDDLQD